MAAKKQIKETTIVTKSASTGRGDPSPWQFQQLAEASFAAANACFADCQRRDKELLPGNTQEPCTFMAITTVFLYFRSIELALKAAIRERGLAPPGKICSKKLGHDLAALIECATTAGQPFTPRELGLNKRSRAFVDRWSKDYASKWFEYDCQPWDIPSLDECQQIATSVTDAVKLIAISLN
jgi:hypothetical protein